MNLFGISIYQHSILDKYPWDHRSYTFELMFGRDPQVPEDVMFPILDHSVTGSSSSPKKYADVLRASLSKSYERVWLYSKKQQHQKQFYDRGARGSPYQAGNIVSLHDPVVKRGHIPQTLERSFQGCKNSWFYNISHSRLQKFQQTWSCPLQSLEACILPTCSRIYSTS